ncbi:MAG TPA: hypothetical protein DIS84_02340 [Corynebacterium stationis]|nr:hypothetical protein [Corynebacterium stationis]
MQKRVPLTSVIGIVAAFISMRVLGNTTDWGGVAIATASLGIALAVTIIAVFIGGALGLSSNENSITGSTKEEGNES